MKSWKTSYADKKFSEFIRERDGRCLRCSTTQGLTCSHYWIRGHSSTRYDPENCITLCWKCHGEMDGKHNKEYMDFMLKRLGEKKYRELEVRARSFKSRSEAVKEFQELYTEAS